jgi:GNAT superfamily N-acetyltransferase
VLEGEDDDGCHRDEHEDDLEDVPDREPDRVELLFAGQAKFHRSGFGQELLARACDTLRNARCQTATLSTDPDTRAERFYRTNGWTAVAHDAKREILFKKRLSAGIGENLQISMIQ